MAVDPPEPGVRVPFNCAVLKGCEFEHLLKTVRDMHVAGHTLMRLPLWNAMSADDVAPVITAVTDYECASA
jgi:hypothetical protein